MIIAESYQPKSSQTRFIIRPNRSLSWQGNVLFFMIMVVISFGIAGIFAAAGYWVILPFAGLEMAALGAGLYLCSLRATWCEVISINNGSVEVVVGRQRPENSYKFDRHWARIVLTPPQARGYPSRLILRSHGRELEVGACLNNEERHHLAKALEKSLGQ